eukprot:GHVR01107055.1.p1 GENE.GHVR01107055.1~~GHVR01107055.1.p1  ORF type:complete len:191 (-),score=46.70 GHVR01107055.1:186-758(-)
MCVYISDQTKKEHSTITLVFDPIVTRASEYNKRGDTKHLIEVTTRTVINQLNTLREKKPWIDEETINSVQNATNILTDWFNTVSKQQESQPLTEDPKYTHNEIYVKVQKLVKRLETVKKIPKPPEPPRPTNTTETINMNTTEAILNDSTNTTDTNTNTNTDVPPESPAGEMDTENVKPSPTVNDTGKDEL